MQRLWSETLGKLRKTTGHAVVDSWFAPLAVLPGSDTEMHLAVPDHQFLDYISTHHLDTIRSAVETIARRPIALRLSVQGATPASVTHEPRQGSLAIDGRPSEIIGHHHDGLVEQLTFDRFVAGISNQLAHGSAVAVSEAPNSVFNPLFIYGGVGIGKTHLLHAIGLATRQRFPGTRILYVSAATFIDDVIHAMRSGSNNTRSTVRDRYRQVDLLLVDDVQFLQGKDRTQEEFFHTFNALHQSGKQIAMTGDRFPSELDQLEQRLRNRFEWGLVAEIKAPDRELRCAILLQKASQAGISLPVDVLHYLADHLRNNVRELEGALNKLRAHSRIGKRPIDLQLARDVLGPIIDLPGRNLTVDAIQRAAARHFGLRITDLKGDKKHRSVAVPRMIAMSLARKYTELSYPELGRVFGGRDHSTVIHACKRIEWLLQTDTRVQGSVQAIESALGR